MFLKIFSTIIKKMDFVYIHKQIFKFVYNNQFIKYISKKIC